ncbi:MAG: HD domain-containing protein [Lachnospiraceae bacterium]|nr:HD domain-containing protein [Lachnospiraceae bacterium]
MKKIYIVDGDAADEKRVADALEGGYEVGSMSYYDINNMALSTVITLANTIDSLDAYAGGHSLRVAVISRDIAGNLGWDEKECQNLYFVALLHDIGMITIPDSIVHKPARLNEFEYDIVRQHTVNGAKILRDISVLDHLREGVTYHHERWNGTGYPEGLAGEDIPPFARVISIADAYDAMTSDRVYRQHLSHEKIISEFDRCKGSQFDPDMTDVFIFMLKGGYTVNPDIGQTQEASERAVRDGGLGKVFGRKMAMTSGDNETDTLTGMFARSYLNTRVGKMISEARSGALMLIRLDGYDSLCDAYDGDECRKVLKLFGKRLATFFREEDVIVRLDDELFAVFVGGQTGKQVIEKKAHIIEDVFASYEEFERYSKHLKAVCTIAKCMEDGVTFEELYDAAMSRQERQQ